MEGIMWKAIILNSNEEERIVGLISRLTYDEAFNEASQVAHDDERIVMCEMKYGDVITL
jgi:hypothetical protein